MKRKLSWVLALILIFTTVMPLMAFADEDAMAQLQEQYEKTYRNKGYLYDLPYGLAKRDGDLPYGLAKKEVLPFGLAKRGIMPTNVIKTLNLEVFVDFVQAVIDAYEGDSNLIDELEELLDAEPINPESILAVLDQLFELDNEEENALAERIEEVYEIMEIYGADEEFIEDIEELLAEEDINWNTIDTMLEALILNSDIYAEALETYEGLVEDIDLLIADEDFEWPDTDTGESFEAVYDLYNGLTDPTIAELNEANRILSQMKEYLELEVMYTIEEGEIILDDLKADLQDLIDGLEFGTGKGEFDPGLETML